MEKIISIGKYAGAIAIIVGLLSLGYNAAQNHFAEKAKNEALFEFFEAHSAYIDSRKDGASQEETDKLSQLEGRIKLIEQRHGIK